MFCNKNLQFFCLLRKLLLITKIISINFTELRYLRGGIKSFSKKNIFFDIIYWDVYLQFLIFSITLILRPNQKIKIKKFIQNLIQKTRQQATNFK